jgi:hypothetical protein
MGVIPVEPRLNFRTSPSTRKIAPEIGLFMYLCSHAEGCPIKLFPTEQQEQIIDLFKAFNAYYPAALLDHRLRNFRAHLDETYFAWIGPFGEHDAFYYRIHSPVGLVGLDFHCGSKFAIWRLRLHDGLWQSSPLTSLTVFLTNTSPARCPIHTVNRLPNAGDYGKSIACTSTRRDERHALVPSNRTPQEMLRIHISESQISALISCIRSQQTMNQGSPPERPPIKHMNQTGLVKLPVG